MSFQELTETYGIPNTHFLKYIALCKAITTQWGSAMSEPDTSPVLHAILSHESARKIITTIYGALLSDVMPTFDTLRTNWETDMSISDGHTVEAGPTTSKSSLEK